MNRKLKLLVLAALLAMGTSSAMAQDCATCNQSGVNQGGYDQGGYGGGRHGHYGWMYGHGRHAFNCGRGITNTQAAGLWSDYCFEDCSYKGGASDGCQLFGGCKTGCCNSGRFGWPAGSGTGGSCGSCGTNCGGHCGGSGIGGFLAACKAKHQAWKGGSGCGDDCGGGCGHWGCFSRCRLFSGKFSGSCGCSDDYFEDVTGRGHGHCFFRSCIRGRLVSECCDESLAPSSVDDTEGDVPEPAVAPTPESEAGSVFFSDEKGEPADNNQTLDEILDGVESIGANHNGRGR